MVMGGALWGKRSVNASEPSKDYWFIETLVLGDVKLPAGVVIRSSDPAASPRGYLDLENQTEAVLYVLSLNYKDVVVMKTPDPNYKNRLNAAHEVASYLVAPDRPARLGMEALTDLDHAFWWIKMFCPLTLHLKTLPSPPLKTPHYCSYMTDRLWWFHSQLLMRLMHTLRLVQRQFKPGLQPPRLLPLPRLHKQQAHPALWDEK